MKQKHKLLILQICGVIFKGLLTVLEKLEATEKAEIVDKSVLEREIPLPNEK